MRCFIAVETPNKLRTAIGSFQESLKTSQSSVRWVKPDRIHLTLKFLGDIEESQQEKIIEILKPIASTTKSIHAEIKGTGGFPNLHRPQVLWAGINDGFQELVHLANGINEALSTLGFKKEKQSFHPHLTLGRVKSLKGIEMIKSRLEKHQETSFGSFNVSDFILFQSVLKPSGPIYTCLHRFALDLRE